MDRCEYKLGDVVNVIGGGTPKTIIDEYWEGNIPWLSIVDFQGNLKHVNQTEKTITELGLAKSSTKILSKGSLIISARGTVGELAILGRDMAFNQSCYGLVGKEDLIINDFLYYILKQKIKQLKNHSHGSVFNTIIRSTFNEILVDLPPLPEQQTIAEILGTLDNKIELNLEINKTLEEMAMAIYKEWFMDFGPFRDGEFVDSELGPIPKGWEVNRLKNIAFITMGQSPSSKYYNQNSQGFSFHQGVKDYGWRFPTNITYSTEGKRFAEKGDILFSVRAPVGRINIAGTKLILGRGLAGIRHREYKNNFLFYSLKTVFTKDDIIGNGTVYKSVNKNDVEGLKILLPDKETLNGFIDITEPIDLLIGANTKEVKTLQDVRDYLLPKLISGEIRVKEPEEQIQKVI